MLTKWSRRTLAVLMAVGLGAGMALAQAPDAPEEVAAPERGAMRARREAAGPRANNPDRMAVFGLVRVLTAQKATIENTAAGVDLTFAAEGAEEIAAVQKRVGDAVAAYQGAAERLQAAAAQNAGDQNAAGGRRRFGLYGLLQNGTLTVAAANIETGVVLSVTTANADDVKQLQDSVQQTATMARMRDVVARLREAQALLAEEGVIIETADAEGGITITITSEDAEKQARIRELLKTYFQDLKEQAAMFGQMGQRGFGPRAGGDAGQGAGMRGQWGGGQGGGFRGQRGGGGQGGGDRGGRGGGRGNRFGAVDRPDGN